MGLLHPAFASLPGALLREISAVRFAGPRAREAIRPALSVLLAVGVPATLNLDDLFWAAFRGYMVMGGSVPESIARAIMRMSGTIGGALLGLLLAPVAADSPAALVAVLLLVSWIGIFQSLASSFSYAWVYFGLTAGMVLTHALSARASVVHFATTRIAEVAIGSGVCLFVACLFSAAPIEKRDRNPVSLWCGHLSELLDKAWLRRHFLPIEHSARVALAVALLPSVWRWFEIENFDQTTTTSFVVMIVPATEIRERRRSCIYERMIHRTVGCLLGSATAQICIRFVGTGFMKMLLVLALGVWLGYSIQTGKEGIGYVGTQFVFGMIITLIQGASPITDVTTELDRVLGTVIGSGMVCFLVLLRPLPEADLSERLELGKSPASVDARRPDPVKIAGSSRPRPRLITRLLHPARPATG